jgi:nucleoside-diphosphate-sugar epimerase
MRLDLVVNTMFKTALQSGRITVNNPSIWRPILAIQDAAAAYVRAVEASPSVSGTFNVASENTTLGALADQVAATLKRNLDLEPDLEILGMADVRNYKVAIDRARVQLGFKPSYDIDKIVWDLIQNRSRFSDLDNPAYQNITTFRALTADGHLGVSRMKAPVPSPDELPTPVEA